jgi:hypothetical protein
MSDAPGTPPPATARTASGKPPGNKLTGRGKLPLRDRAGLGGVGQPVDREPPSFPPGEGLR